jgi:hypothetical protein
MFRLFLSAVAAALALPAVASAQFFIPATSPPGHPLSGLAPYRYQPYFGVPAQSIYGRVIVGAPIPYYDPVLSDPRLPFSNWYARPYSNPAIPSWAGGRGVTSGYMSGGAIRNDMQRDFEKAQKEASRLWGASDSAKTLITEQWSYEKLGTKPAVTAGKSQDDALVKALGAVTEADIASGEPLNQILAAIATAEAKGGKAVSAFLGPQQVDEIRFGGALGETLNLIRLSGRLPFPPVFSVPEMRDVRDALERDFAAATAPLLAGKPVDAGKLMQLEFTLKKVEEIAPPYVREEAFEDAVAARCFLNQLANAVRTLKAGGLTGLVNPAWASDGTTVAELVKHMTKFKLQFGPAPEGSEPTYLTLHRALATYLFVLTQPKK